MAEVLLVDDDGSVLLTLAIALRRQGHGVTVAGDAFQAMTHLGKSRFDFLISDVRMPGISGLELAARARALPTPPRVILTSAYPFVEDRESVAEAFMQKPLDVHLLSKYLNSSGPSNMGAPLSVPPVPTAPAGSPAEAPESPVRSEAQGSARTEPPRVEPQRVDLNRGLSARTAKPIFPRRASRASA